MKYIERTNYLNRLIGLKNTPDIKIITGIRRSGKSELMRAYIEYLKKNDKKANIIYLDFYDLEYEEYKDYKRLNDYVNNHYKKSKNNYLFIDEIQLCKSFELAINSFNNSGKFDIYITGSNAFLLSSDLATLFTGRFIEIKVFPFSLYEFSRYYNDIDNREDLFDEYVTKGGLAGSYIYKQEVEPLLQIKDAYPKIIVARTRHEKYQYNGIQIINISDWLLE